MKPLHHGMGPDATRREAPGQKETSSDAELVGAARRGDKQAFVEIVARHQAMVCGIALGILGDIAASEDAGQEAFLTAWRKIHELREPGSLRSWLRQIARHAALGYHRRQRGHDPLEEMPDLPDLTPAPDEQAANQEEAALVREALNQLPEVYRAPLILYYRENQSARAVAEALDLSEEAVRQRLARGRELLREQVSGVIEGVLSRTRPTAIFTMGIAVAIGALAPPAVVAGSVFSAAAAGSGTATPAFLKALLGSKTFLFVAALVTLVSIPAGYQLHLRPTGELLESRKIIEEPAAPAEVKAPEAMSSAIFAEWKRLHDTHGTNVEALPNIYREISRFNNPLWRQGFRAALMAEWVQLDPTNAMAAFRDRTVDPGLRAQFIDEWMQRDAATAVDTILASGRGAAATVRHLLPELARRAPGLVAGLVAKLPRPDSARDMQVRDAYAILAQGGIDSIRAKAESMTSPHRDQALAGVGQAWGRRDLGAAIAWARQLPDGTDREEIIRCALVGAASNDPVAALEQVTIVPPGGRKGYFASTTVARVLKAAGQADFDVTVEWLADHPGQFSSEDLLGLTDSIAERLNADPSGFLSQYATSGSLPALLPAIAHTLANESSGQRRAVWDWLQAQAESSFTQELSRELLGSIGAQDAALAFRLAATAPATAVGAAQLRLLAEGLLARGLGMHRLEPLLAEAPERLRRPLLEAAFDHLRAESLDQPRRWVEHLAQLPEPAQARGVESLARAWADQMPEDAIHWASAMPAGDSRASAVAGIAGTWAEKDPSAASQWVAAMPASPERDRGAQSLVFALAGEYPSDSWEWAMSIVEPSARTRAATHAAKVLAAQDASLARAWVESSPLPPETRTVIQAALEANGTTPPAP